MVGKIVLCVCVYSIYTYIVRNTESDPTPHSSLDPIIPTLCNRKGRLRHTGESEFYAEESWNFHHSLSMSISLNHTKKLSHDPLLWI